MKIALVQIRNQQTRDLDAFEARLRTLVTLYPGFPMWIFPEFHLEPDASHHDPHGAARILDDPSLVRLAALAGELGIWLLPGSVYERSEAGVHNTALVFAPSGERVAVYRKIFPWRPLEPSVPGATFEAFDVPGEGRVGISICYDIWFPEHARHLAWMGADLIVNLVQTVTADREQELAIVRGNAIMNQVWIASVNAAAPTGRGRSLVVDPQGTVRASSPDASEEILTAVVDLAEARRVREDGTAGVSRPWHQFRDGDAAIELPLYGGRISPASWTPPTGG